MNDKQGHGFSIKNTIVEQIQDGGMSGDSKNSFENQKYYKNIVN